MTDDKEDAIGAQTEEKGCCGGSKMLVGGLIGLVLAGTGFGLYHMGKCAGKVCPVSQQSQPVK